MGCKPHEYFPHELDENSSIPANFLSSAARYGHQTALIFRQNDEWSGRYAWSDWTRHVRYTALGLYALGIRKGEVIGILSENRPEWTFADLGALSLGAIVVPIYTTSSLDDMRYIVSHSGLKAIFVSTPQLLDKVLELGVPLLHGRLIIFSDKPCKGALSLGELESKGRVLELNDDGIYLSCLKKVSGDDVATFVYTSGSTDIPKAVMLTHRNFIANCSGSRRYVPLGEGDRLVSFLPLSHIFERTAGYYCAMFYGAEIAYAASLQSVAEDIRAVRPTIVFAVPRFFEKAHSRILDEMQKVCPFVRAIFSWTISLGKWISIRKQTDRRIGMIAGFLYRLAGFLVFRKIATAFGGRIRFFVSGGAPLSSDLARFFHAADMLILEGYGLTETSPVIAVNSPLFYRLGSVGRPVPNIRVRIAGDGEIVISGPSVMKGYYRQPEATNGCIRGGEFYSGDIGYLDESGFLHVTDRKKDIIVTAGGKNVAPQKLEARILSDRWFAQVLIIGDQRPYLCALIVPKRDELTTAACALNLHHLSYRDLLSHPEIRQQVCVRLEKCQEGLAAYECIKAFELLEHEFTIEEGALTPTLKIKRRVVCDRYHDLIEDLYHRADREWAAQSDLRGAVA